MQYDPTTIRSWMLKISSFWRLDKLPVMRGCHFFLQLGQYILHAVLSLPICKKPKFLWFNLLHINLDYISDNNGFKVITKKQRDCVSTVCNFICASTEWTKKYLEDDMKACGNCNWYHASFMVNTSHIDSWMKPNTWGLFWVIFVAKQLQLINSAFMYSLKVKIKENMITWPENDLLSTHKMKVDTIDRKINTVQTFRFQDTPIIHTTFFTVLH